MELTKVSYRLNSLKNDYGKIFKLLGSEHKEVSRMAKIQLKEIDMEIKKLERKYKELSN